MSASAMASGKRQRSEIETMRVEDVDAFNCGICYHPLMPPIFQCKEGHPLCSSCRDKIAPTGKCYVCGTSTRSGYIRCRGMEHMVESVRVSCPNATHGCDARMIYYDLADHRQVCPHAQCHCPGEDCSFIGTVKELLDHITSWHAWPCTVRDIMDGETHVSLKGGFNFLIADRLVDEYGAAITSTTGQFLFLLNVVRQPFRHTISVVRIHPHTTTVGMTCVLSFDTGNFYDHPSERHGTFRHFLQSELSVKSTDLSNGVPKPESTRFQFVLPNSFLGELEEETNEVIPIKVCIIV